MELTRSFYEHLHRMWTFLARNVKSRDFWADYDTWGFAKYTENFKNLKPNF